MRNKAWVREFLLMSLTTSPERPILFYLVGLFGTVLITSWAADYMKDVWQPRIGWAGLLGVWAGILAMGFGVYVAYITLSRRYKRFELDTEIREHPVPSRGLILFLSPLFKEPNESQRILLEKAERIFDAPSDMNDLWEAWLYTGMPQEWSKVQESGLNLVPPLTALSIHKDRIARCWLITSQESRYAASIFECIVRKLGWANEELQFVYGKDWVVPGTGDKDMVDGSFDKVNAVYSSLSECNLSEKDVVCDVTGGHKPHSIGAALACLPFNRTLQYSGSMIGKPIKPIEIRYRLKVFDATL